MIWTVVRIAAGPTHSVHLHSVDDVRAALAERDGGSVFAFCDLPSVELRDLLLRVGAPFLIAYEDPEELIGYSMAERQINFRDALRLAVSRMCALHDLFISDIATIVNRKDLTTLSAFVDLIASTYHISVDPDKKVEILAELSRLPPDQASDVLCETLIIREVNHARPPGGYAFDVLGAHDQSIANMLRQYAKVGQGQSVDHVNWPTPVFMNSERPDTEAARRYDLTGKARMLVYGPYLFLPPGSWTAEVHFVIGQNRSGNSLHFDVAMREKVLALCEVKLPHAGQYKIGMEFEVVEADANIEVRMEMRQGAIEGWFSLLSVEMRRSSHGEQIEAAARDAS